MKTFNLNLSFDGNMLSVDYCDGSDVETYTIASEQELKALVDDLVGGCLSPEDD